MESTFYMYYLHIFLIDTSSPGIRVRVPGAVDAALLLEEIWPGKVGVDSSPAGIFPILV
jgi:hypothetical protein